MLGDPFPMNAKWNPIVLMSVGGGLVLFAYVTTLVVEMDGVQTWAALSVIAFGMLTLASGVVLAYLHFFREGTGPAVSRFARR